MKNFLKIDYLAKGNVTQKKAFDTLNELKIFEILEQFQPILVGTVPICIDIKGSDLDIICRADDFVRFEEIVRESFSHYQGFSVTKGDAHVVINFSHKMPIEIFAQNLPTICQNAYRHMIIEYRCLQLFGEGFRQQVVGLKQSGIKTESAFAQLLGIKGDPYAELLDLENLTIEEIARMR